MQGKAWDKEKVTELLKPFLKLGLSVTKACSCIGIPQTTVSTWLEDDEELRLLFGTWQSEIENEARTVIQKAIKGGDVSSAKWWLERKSKEEFSLKGEPEKDEPENRSFTSMSKEELTDVLTKHYFEEWRHGEKHNHADFDEFSLDNGGNGKEFSYNDFIAWRDSKTATSKTA